MYNHALHVAFEVFSEDENPDLIADEEVLACLTERVAYLIRHPREICQACEAYDCYEK